MIKISKSELKEKLIQLMELGLTNADIATRLNEEYNADESNSLTAMKVAQLKDAVGLKGWKPKKKSLFELVEDDEISESQTQLPIEYPDESMEEERFISSEY